MARKTMTQDEFAAILRLVADAQSESGLAKIIHEDSPKWGSMDDKQLHMFQIAMNAHQDYLDDKKRILGMTTPERVAYVEFNKRFDYRSYLIKILDDRQRTLGFANPSREFYIDILSAYREKLTAFAEELSDGKAKPILTAFIATKAEETTTQGSAMNMSDIRIIP